MKPKGAKNKKGVSVQKSVYGYLEVFCPEHPVAKKNGYCAIHRQVAYDAGLLKNLSMRVHHKNGNKTDNRIKNLEVISNAEHTSLHWRGKKRGKMSNERRLAISKRMKGNKNWRGNVHESPELLTKG